MIVREKDDTLLPARWPVSFYPRVALSCTQPAMMCHDAHGPDRKKGILLPFGAWPMGHIDHALIIRAKSLAGTSMQPTTELVCLFVFTSSTWVFCLAKTKRSLERIKWMIVGFKQDYIVEGKTVETPFPWGRETSPDHPACCLLMCVPPFQNGRSCQ